MHAHAGVASGDRVWIDSGANYHLGKNLSWFFNYRVLLTPEPITGIAGSASVIGVGDIAFLAKLSGGQTSRFVFTDVLHAPGIVVNLISVSRLDKNGLRITVSNGVARMESKKHTPLAGAPQQEQPLLARRHGRTPSSAAEYVHSLRHTHLLPLILRPNMASQILAAVTEPQKPSESSVLAAKTEPHTASEPYWLQERAMLQRKPIVSQQPSFKTASKHTASMS